VTNIIHIDIPLIWKHLPEGERYNLTAFAQQTGRTVENIIREDLLASEEEPPATNISPHHPSNF
jgi:hypothetical protein